MKGHGRLRLITGVCEQRASDTRVVGQEEPSPVSVQHQASNIKLQEDQRRTLFQILLALKTKNDKAQQKLFSSEERKATRERDASFHYLLLIR